MDIGNYPNLVRYCQQQHSDPRIIITFLQTLGLTVVQLLEELAGYRLQNSKHTDVNFQPTVNLFG